MKKQHLFQYSILIITLCLLAFFYILYSQWRFIISTVIGLTYFLFGVIIHLKDKTLYLSVILEYFGLGLLGAIILIFISLRA